MAGTKTDPVCKMDVDTKVARETSKHKGETFYFCSSECKDKFEKSPERYLGEKKKSTGKK